MDGRNPQVAARLANSFNQWKKLDAKRQALMKEQLERIKAHEGILEGQLRDRLARAQVSGAGAEGRDDLTSHEWETRTTINDDTRNSVGGHAHDGASTGSASPTAAAEPGAITLNYSEMEGAAGRERSRFVASRPGRGRRVNRGGNSVGAAASRCNLRYRRLDADEERKRAARAAALAASRAPAVCAAPRRRRGGGGGRRLRMPRPREVRAAVGRSRAPATMDKGTFRSRRLHGARRCRGDAGRPGCCACLAPARSCRSWRRCWPSS